MNEINDKEELVAPCENAAPSEENSEQKEQPNPSVQDVPKLTPAQMRKRTVLQWLIMTAGILMMAISVYFFQTPNNFTLGGVAGIALLLANAVSETAPFLTQGVFIAIINVFLIILGLTILGKQCTIKTIYCSLLYTVIIFVFEQVVGPNNQPIRLNFPMTDQPFMELCYAILFFGMGGALIFNCGATSGGTDIIALILKKYTKLNVGVALMIIDFIVVCISFGTFSIQSALYSLLGLFAKSFLLDGIIESIGKTKCITIITTHPDLISDYILKDINHGYTVYDAEGGYTGEPKKVMITVCKRSEALKLKQKVLSTDPTSFVIITDANEILGKGFGGTI